MALGDEAEAAGLCAAQRVPGRQRGFWSSGGEVALSLAVALGLFVLLFIVLPNVIVALSQQRISSVVLVNLIEGALRVAIFATIMLGIAVTDAKIR